jgi:hypothetical protein
LHTAAWVSPQEFIQSHDPRADGVVNSKEHHSHWNDQVCGIKRADHLWTGIIELTIGLSLKVPALHQSNPS